MRIQLFSLYRTLAQAGKVDFLACPMHGEEPYVLYELIHFDVEDKIVLQCLACGYKNTVGQQLYENIIERVRKVDNGIYSTTW